jgi:hypothetical protein
MAGINHFEGFPPPPINPTPILALFTSKSFHGIRSRALVE